MRPGQRAESSFSYSTGFQQFFDFTQVLLFGFIPEIAMVEEADAARGIEHERCRHRFNLRLRDELLFGIADDGEFRGRGFEKCLHPGALFVHVDGEDNEAMACVTLVQLVEGWERLLAGGAPRS